MQARLFKRQVIRVLEQGRLSSIDFLLLTAGETVTALVAAYLGEWFGNPQVAGWTGFGVGFVTWMGLQALMWIRRPAPSVVATGD